MGYEITDSLALSHHRITILKLKILYSMAHTRPQNNNTINNKLSTINYRIVCDICKGVNISSNAASFRLAPLKFASFKSLPDKSQFYKKQTHSKQKNTTEVHYFQVGTCKNSSPQITVS